MRDSFALLKEEGLRTYFGERSANIVLEDNHHEKDEGVKEAIDQPREGNKANLLRDEINRRDGEKPQQHRECTGATDN